MHRYGRTIESGMKILEIFGENRPEFVEKCKITKIITKFKIFKRCKLLENESAFKNFNIFLPKNPFFSKKNFETLNIFYKINSNKYFQNFNFYGGTL